MRNFTTKTHKVETLRHTKKIRILEKISPQRTNFKNKIRGNQFNPFNPRSNKTSTHFYEFLPQRTNFRDKIRANPLNPFNPRSNKTSTHFYEFLPQRTNFRDKIRANPFNPFNLRSKKTSTHFYEFLPQRNTKQNTKNHKEINSPRIFA